MPFVAGSNPARSTIKMILGGERAMEYTIMQYDKNTKEYERLAHVRAPDAEKAKAKYIKENKWQAKEGVTLFVKLPLCR